MRRLEGVPLVSYRIKRVEGEGRSPKLRQSLFLWNH